MYLSIYGAAESKELASEGIRLIVFNLIQFAVVFRIIL